MKGLNKIWSYTYSTIYCNFLAIMVLLFAIFFSICFANLYTQVKEIENYHNSCISDYVVLQE